MSTFDSELWDGGSSTSESTVQPTQISDLLYHALRLARVTLGPDRTPSTAQYNDALRAANRMLARWNADSLTVPCGQIESFQLVADQKVHTMGPGGDFDTGRPQRIERANLILPDGSRKPLEVVEADSWADIRLPDQTSEPRKLFNDRAPGLVNLYIWPQDTGADQIELFSWKLIERFVSKDDLVTLAEGYEEALVYNLAVRLATMFHTGVDEDVREIARTSLSDIQSLNAPAPIMQCDPSIVVAGQIWSFTE